jgi:hypothetical protein
MPDPLKGDYRMDPATARRHHPGQVKSAFKTKLGVALVIVFILLIVFGLMALFLLPSG